MGVLFEFLPPFIDFGSGFLMVFVSIFILGVWIFVYSSVENSRRRKFYRKELGTENLSREVVEGISDRVSGVRKYGYLFNSSIFFVDLSNIYKKANFIKKKKDSRRDFDFGVANVMAVFGEVDNKIFFRLSQQAFWLRGLVKGVYDVNKVKDRLKMSVRIKGDISGSAEELKRSIREVIPVKMKLIKLKVREDFVFLMLQSRGGFSESSCFKPAVKVLDMIYQFLG